MLNNCKAQVDSQMSNMMTDQMNQSGLNMSHAQDASNG
jgi:hypothetical protein